MYTAVRFVKPEQLSSCTQLVTDTSVILALSTCRSSVVEHERPQAGAGSRDDVSKAIRIPPISDNGSR